VLSLLCVLSLLFQFFVEARNGGLGLRLESGGLGLGLPISVGLGFAVGKWWFGFGLTARVVEGWLGLVGVVVIRWLGVVDSVGLGLCRGLEWFHRWVWVFAEAWGG
jgi:hypothetical protein